MSTTGMLKMDLLMGCYLDTYRFFAYEYKLYGTRPPWLEPEPKQLMNRLMLNVGRDITRYRRYLHRLAKGVAQ